MWIGPFPTYVWLELVRCWAEIDAYRLRVCCRALRDLFTQFESPIAIAVTEQWFGARLDAAPSAVSTDWPQATALERLTRMVRCSFVMPAHYTLLYRALQYGSTPPSSTATVSTNNVVSLRPAACTSNKVDRATSCLTVTPRDAFFVEFDILSIPERRTLAFGLCLERFCFAGRMLGCCSAEIALMACGGRMQVDRVYVDCTSPQLSAGQTVGVLLLDGRVFLGVRSTDSNEWTYRSNTELPVQDEGTRYKFCVALPPQVEEDLKVRVRSRALTTQRAQTLTKNSIVIPKVVYSVPMPMV